MIHRVSFDPEANYLLVGCLGGLGRSIARWMAERGARHLTFISRSGASSVEAAATIRDLEDMGVQTKIFQCSITERSELLAAVRQTSNAIPIKGVLHAAMVEGVSISSLNTLEHQIFSQRFIRTRLLNLHLSNRYETCWRQKFKEPLTYMTQL